MKPKTLAEIRKMEDHTDWERFNKGGDFEGEDEDDFEVDWDSAVMVYPKKPISLRVDSDVLDFFKSQGKGYQTRMNAVLRAYMEAQLKR